MLLAILPRALESESSILAAQLYATLADANMGLAGTTGLSTNRKSEYMTKGLRAVEKAFDHYSNVEDTNRQCEMMAKKAMIMKLSGEMGLAADYAAAYVALRKTAESFRLG
jgi:anaphase-promoting complex subunit 5